MAIRVPILTNAALVGILMAYINARFNAVDRRFEGMDRRFDDMRDLWRSELHRVEGVLDARLRHIEESR
jgi:hypothetical protein